MNIKNRNFKTQVAMISIAALVGLTAQSALAQKAGDNVVVLGGAYLSFNSSVGPLNSTGSSAAEAGGFNLINQTYGPTTAEAKNTSTLSATFLHMVTDNIGVELGVGVPPTVKLDLNVPGAGVVYKGQLPTNYSDGASAKPWAPVLAVKYLFNEPSAKFRPYLGLGVNYTWFSDVEMQDATLLNKMAGNGTKLSSSWNPVALAGLTYNLDASWSLNASLTYIPLKTNASFTSGSGATTTTGKLKLNPTIFNVGVGYKF